jgi:hypothetical protein
MENNERLNTARKCGSTGLLTNHSETERDKIIRQPHFPFKYFTLLVHKVKGKFPSPRHEGI